MRKEEIENLIAGLTAEKLNQKYPLTEQEFKAILILHRKDLFASWLEFNKPTLREQLFLIEPENDEMFMLVNEQLDPQAEVALMQYNHPAVLAYLRRFRIASEALDALVCGENFDLFLFMVQEYPDYEALHKAIQRNPQHKMYKRMRTRNVAFKSHERELIESGDMEAFELQCQYLGLSNTSQRLLIKSGNIDKFLVYIKYRKLSCHDAQIALVEARDERLDIYIRRYGSRSLCEFAQILLP